VSQPRQPRAAPPATPRPPARFVIITGLSGSGKSSALAALEDVGYYAVDNLPAELLPAFVDLPLKYARRPFKAALVMDMRDPGFLDRFPPTIERLGQGGFPVEILFLEADEQTLVRRYSQTRRHHPLAGPDEPLVEVIGREKKALAGLRSMAHQVLDTSRFTIHQLRQEITRLYSHSSELTRLQINLISFGYKYGLPLEADVVMDVRFLDNPYFIQELRELDGRDQAVVDYVCGQEATQTFLNKFKDLLDFLLPRYHREGKSQLTVAMGCTGGQHRSVVVTQWLAGQLKQADHRVTVRHRDIKQDRERS